VGALALSLVPLAAATDTENYSACLQSGDPGVPDCEGSLTAHSSIPAGTTVGLTVTVTNTAPVPEEGSPSTLASVNIKAPAGIAIDPGTASYNGDSGTIELRDLDLVPGQSVIVTFDATASCVDASVASNLAWTIEGAHPEDTAFFALTGPGVVSDITGRCKLVWNTQPATTNKNVVITGTPYNTPAGNPVAVGAVDANGNPIPAPSGVTLAKSAGDFTDTASSGGFIGVSGTVVGNEARFGTLKSSRTGSGLKLQASASGFDSTPNTGTGSPHTFSITFNGNTCPVGQNCSVPTTPLNTNSQVTVTGTGGSFVFLGVGPTTIPGSVTGAGGGCESYTPLSANGFELAEDRTGGELRFIYSIDKKSVEKKYGTSSTSRAIPLCAGAARVVSGVPQACSSSQPGWLGLELKNGLITGKTKAAKCDTGTGLYWGILGSFQDKKVIDPNQNPTVTSWETLNGFRNFSIRVPSPWDWKMG
jgi:hypothetical protein